MKTTKSLSLFALFILLLIAGCKKDQVDSSACYTPTTADVTANATLAELQQGRSLYIANCGRCHGLYSPDGYSVNQWKNVLSIMTPKTSLSSTQVLLVTKYVCKGQQ